MNDQTAKRMTNLTEARRRFELRPLVGFRRVTRAEPCPICGATKYCQITKDDRLAHCMKESRGSRKRAKDGGFVHVLVEEGRPSTSTQLRVRAGGSHDGTTGTTLEQIALAPPEVIDATYRKLIELSPPWKYEQALVTARPDGLLTRGLHKEKT